MKGTANRLRTVEEYYFSKKLREVRQLASEGHPIINIGIGSPDLSPPTAVVEAMVSSIKNPGAHQYQSYSGRPELRKAIADFYQKRYSVFLDKESEILPMMGSKEAIMHISLAFLNEGDEVLIPDPGYPTYSSVTKLVGAIPKYYDLQDANNWLPNLEQIASEDLSKVKIMWINYPHMPTGAKASIAQLEAMVAFAKKHKILLVNDNPYSFILNDKPLSILSVLNATEVAIELNSLSKSFNMAGWRVGMALGKSEFIQAILKVKSNMDSGMFYGIQSGAIAALNNEDKWFEDLNTVYQKRRNLIFKMADLLECTYSSNAAGMFVWAKLPSEIKTSEEFTNDLLYKHDIFVAPGNIFGSNGEGYIRFSLCVSEKKIKEAISRIKNKA